MSALRTRIDVAATGLHAKERQPPAKRLSACQRSCERPGNAVCCRTRHDTGAPVLRAVVDLSEIVSTAIWRGDDGDVWGSSSNDLTAFQFGLFVLADSCRAAWQQHLDACRIGPRRLALKWISSCVVGAITCEVAGSAITWSFSYLYHPYLEGARPSFRGHMARSSEQASARRNASCFVEYRGRHGLS